MRRSKAGVAMIVVMALALAGCARELSGAAVIRSSALSSLPRESVGLFVVEVGSLRRMQNFSTWMEQMAETAERGGPLREIRDRFGLEAVKNLDRLGLVIVPMEEMGLGYGILAEGQFDQEALRETLGDEDIVTFLQIEGEPDLSATVTEGGHLAFGPRAVLEKIRRNASGGGEGIDLNEGLLGMLESVDGTSQIWGAVDCRAIADLARHTTRGALLFEKGPIPDSALSNALESLAFQGRFGRDLEFDLFGEADAEENAELLADTLRGLIAFGRIGASQDVESDWTAMLDGLDIEQEGRTITLRGTIPEKSLVALAESVGAEMPALPAAPQD